MMDVDQFLETIGVMIRREFHFVKCMYALEDWD